MPAFRNGQWVSFTASVEGAHIANGRHVGIHMDGSVHPVDPLGDNLWGPGGVLTLPPEGCGDVRPLLDKGHIPGPRRDTLHPDFVLKP